MPTYNQCQYLPTAIESVLGQTFSDYELIISDNASSDDTEHVAMSYAKSDRRLHYYRNSANLGVCRNFDLSLTRASHSSHFAFLSSDDWWHPTLLERLVASAAIAPSATLVHCDAYRVDETGAIINLYSELWPEMPPVGSHRSIRELFLNGCYFNINATLINRSQLLALYPNDQLFDPTLKYTPDYHLWLQLMIRGATAYYVPEPLAFYRKHDAAHTTTKNVIARLQEQVLIFREKLAEVCPAQYESLRQEALLINLKQLGFVLLAAGRKAEALPVLTEAHQLAAGRQLDVKVAARLAASPLPPTLAAWGWRAVAAGAQKVRQNS
ncbi:MAG: glycosyltransferase [Anaerolinea sp.]|nr:glycosyltransferase [Anaerolinea sp.]